MLQLHCQKKKKAGQSYGMPKYIYMMMIMMMMMMMMMMMVMCLLRKLVTRNKIISATYTYWIYSFQSLESEDEDDSCEDLDFKVNGNISESSDEYEYSEPGKGERIKRKVMVVSTPVYQKISKNVDKFDRKISTKKTMTTVTRPNKTNKVFDDIIKDTYSF